MGNYVNQKAFDGGIAGNTNPQRIHLDANGIASGQSFLVSELEKREMDIKKPLTSVTYPRDIKVNVGGGWVDTISAVAVEYGATDDGDGSITATNSDGVPVVNVNFNKGQFKAHPFMRSLRIGWIDVQRANQIGRSLDQALREGVRLVYDKHMDKNVYQGFALYGTTGLINNADVTATSASTGAGGGTTFASKTPDEILNDINQAINTVWASCDYDEDAIPNHILLPYSDYALLVNRKVSDIGDKSVLTYLLENNIAKMKGVDLKIEGCKWCDGAGVGSTDRMVVYVNKERFLSVDELQPLSMVMTTPSAKYASYDTLYSANVGEVKLYYTQTILYVDGV